MKPAIILLVFVLLITGCSPDQQKRIIKSTDYFELLVLDNVSLSFPKGSHLQSLEFDRINFEVKLEDSVYGRIESFESQIPLEDFAETLINKVRSKTQDLTVTNRRNAKGVLYLDLEYDDKSSIFYSSVLITKQANNILLVYLFTKDIKHKEFIKNTIGRILR